MSSEQPTATTSQISPARTQLLRLQDHTSEIIKRLCEYINNDQQPYQVDWDLVIRTVHARDSMGELLSQEEDCFPTGLEMLTSQAMDVLQTDLGNGQPARTYVLPFLTAWQNVYEEVNTTQ